MAKFTVQHPHAHPPEEIRRRVDALAGKLAQKFGISSTWARPGYATWSTSGGGAAGSITCAPGKVVIEVDLGFMLSLMRPKIEEGLREELRNALA